MNAGTETMPALTVLQPHTGCIAWLGKDTENRSRRCPEKFTGCDVAIHAAADTDRWATALPPGFEGLFGAPAQVVAWQQWQRKPRRGPRDTGHWPLRLALGAVVAVATITGSHPCREHDYCRGQGVQVLPGGLCSPWARPWGWHWTLADVRPLATPVPCKGAQGFWRLPDAVDKLVRQQAADFAAAGTEASDV